MLDNLNEKQREAVLETEGYVRVIAGAGSGKTKLLVSRYAYLVKEYGIDSANILCVTFTNKAAGEMKKRIRALIGEEYDTTLICTYHGFCNRLLRENPEKLFLNKQFQILDTHQQKAILSEIYQKFELKLDYAAFESILRKIGKFKRDIGYVRRMCNPKPCQILPEIRDLKEQIMEEFLQRQKATYSLDFHDLISYAIYVLENSSDVREKWQDRLNYIMVDEFQDSSNVEMHLIEILSAKYQNLMIVGDPDQNIYEWRGSDVKLLVDFDKEHEPTKTIFLNQNYRSTPEILKCANTLIEKNELRLKKDLFTEKANGSPVIHYHSQNDFDEMDVVVDNIKRLCVGEKYRFSDFAILYRSGFLSRLAEKKLVERNIPYEIFGGVKFYQRMEILDILAYLKLIAFDDDTSFRRIVNTPRRRFGRAKMNLLDELHENGSRKRVQMDLFSFAEENLKRENIAKDSLSGELEYNSGTEGKRENSEHKPAVQNLLTEVKKSMFQILAENLGEKEFQNSDVSSFVSYIKDIRERSRGMRISEIVNEVTKQTGYESYIRELGDEDRLDNLAEFKRIANEFEREFGEDLSLTEFLQQIALQSGEDKEENKDTVKLMTIHASKGLEFPVVFILGFSEGIFPSSKTIEERKNLGLEEERRLCYVAITRAEKHLFLMDSEGLSQNGNKKLCSRFLEEIGEENYIRIGRISDDVLQESRNYRAKKEELLKEENTPDTESKVGDRVEHHVFGPGIIENIDTRHGSYIVKFEKLAQPRNISKEYFKRVHGKQWATEKEKTAEAQHSDLGKESKVQENDLLIKHKAEKSAVHEEAWKELRQGVLRPQLEEQKSNADEEGRKESRQEILQPQLEKSNSYEEKHKEFKQEILRPQQEEERSGIQEELTKKVLKEDERKRKLQELKDNSPNLWKREDVPHSGWECVGVDDLGEPVGICEMCGYQIIRYAHRMTHSKYRTLTCGCICAGRMEGNVEEAKRREAELRKKQRGKI